jgi:hypothetical protein
MPRTSLSRTLIGLTVFGVAFLIGLAHARFAQASEAV